MWGMKTRHVCLVTVVLLGLSLGLVGCGPTQSSPAATAVAALPPPPPPPPPPADWTLVQLPDTQYYSESYPKHWAAISTWIVDNVEAENIKFVVNVGDITNDNSERQWTVARENLEPIMAAVPTALTTGNHDYGRGPGPAGRGTRFEQFFPPEEFLAQPTAGALYSPDSMASSYQTFSVNGQDWLILSLEFGPRDEVVDWANQVLAEHPNHAVILNTHAYLTNQGPRLDQHNKRFGHNPHKYPMAKTAGGVNDGEELWQKLVQPNPNVVLVLSGHVSGVNRRVDENAHGNEVHQVVANYQSETEGGNGYIRLLRFSADGTRIDVRSYSPVLDREKKVAQGNFTLDLTHTFLWAGKEPPVLQDDAAAELEPAA